MRLPPLNEVAYFRIPPSVTFSDLEAKLREVGLQSNDLVEKAQDIAQIIHANESRNSGASVLEEHIAPVTLSVLEYQLWEKERKNPKFAKINPEAVVVGLTHDILDSSVLSLAEFKRLFGEVIFNMVWPLTDAYYYGQFETYRQRIEMKFEKLNTTPWQAQVVGLADRLNQLLCYYTPPYLDERRKPTERMKRAISIARDIVLPFAKAVSPEFFYPMFEELMAHYRKEYPNLFPAK